MTLLIEKTLMEGLRELSNRKIQEELWLEKTDEIGSFQEAVAYVFSDSLYDYLRNEGEPVFGDNVDGMFDSLFQLVLEVEDGDVQAIIDCPEMNEIRALASRILSEMEKRPAQKT